MEQFKRGQMNMHDTKRTGWLSDAVNDETINIVHILLQMDHHLIFSDFQHEIAQEYSYVNISETLVFCFINEELGMWKVNVR